VILSDKENIVKKTNELLIKFINEFQQNPFEYFYEEDIRASLYAILNSGINVRCDFPTKDYSEQIKSPIIQSSVIKAEYPYYKRFDIAFLSYQKEKDFYNQPVFMAIEIKLGSHEIGSDKTAGFKGDIVKLRDCLTTYGDEGFIGIALYFCQTLILKEDIDRWYKEISFEQIDLSQIVLSKNNVYAIIVAGKKSEKIFISKREL